MPFRLSARQFHRVQCCVVVTVFLAAAFVQDAGAATLPAGFRESTVASGLSSPTAMQFAPDGRLFVCEQSGSLRVVKNGSLLPAPFVTLTVSSAGERGLLGVAFDPNFATNQFVYVYYTATTPAIHNRISRFTANGDVAVAGSEVVLLDLDNLSSATNHNGGALAFGADGKLYAAVGENANGANAQTLANLLGKMLRINNDGTIPSDNPFVSSASGKNRAIWALGLRNPFTFAFNPGGAEMFINDVGQNTWEEIDDGRAGANYGWPNTEGPTSDPAYVSPRYAYDHSTGGCAITGGAFYSPLTNQFPADYQRDYFFADFCGGWIRRLDPNAGNAVTGFATGIASPVDLKVNDDGSLYYLARGSGAGGGVVMRVTFTTTAPTITMQPSNQTVAAGGSATFSVRASGDAPLSFQWQRNGVDINGATSQDFTLSANAADNGARFRARVTNNAGNALSNEAVLTVTSSGSGGLAATYYDAINFSGTTVTRVDSTVDFVWGAGSPAAAIGPDTFSARWTGEVQPQFSETYTFYTQSDDGVRLWVNGQLLIDNWTDHGTTENNGTIALVGSQRYTIRMEYYEQAGSATARLLWSSASTAKAVIPAARLTPTTPPGGPIPFRGTPIAIPGIVQAEEFDEGGEGVAYHDLGAGNDGGAFRATGVDIESTSDTGGGYNVGWMSAGEWLLYTIDVARAGTYTIEARVAADGQGGRFHLEANGATLGGPFTIPNTFGWQNWTTLTATGVTLAAGRQTLRIVLDADGPTGVFGNVNYLRISDTSAPTATDVVIYASDVPAAAGHGGWASTSDAASPNGIALATPDSGFASTDSPQASPAHYFEATFAAPANTPYTVWLRLKALGNSKFNDAVWVQFSDAITSGGAPLYPVGTSSGLLVNLATDSGASSLNAWGWQNGAYWLDQSSTIIFSGNGPHVIRVQVREDGVTIDQVVLSPQTYRTTPPGGPTNDHTIVPKPSS